jgi:Protein of unknown function (DUF2585)
MTATRIYRIPPRAFLLAVPAIIALQTILLLAMGRVPICECGTVKLWHGATYSSENSQHIFDWYSFTHLEHGLGLYFFVWLLMPRAPLGLRLAVAVLIEAGWEVLENSNVIIERYRAATISLDYYGDSIVNSVADTVTMIFGFLLAARLPVWGSITLAVAMEVALAWLIRDNLTLNVIMLLHSFEGIKAWQEAPR